MLGNPIDYQLFKRIVSNTPSARKLEKCLRDLYTWKADINISLEEGTLKQEFVKEYRKEQAKFWDIDAANTPDEIYTLWVNMWNVLIDANEIYEKASAVTYDKETKYWLQQWKLEPFAEFVWMWREYRQQEKRVLQGKAATYGVNLHKMFKEDCIKLGLKNV